ncbi:hypothetical protein EDD18DRAFT_1442434 [Armillaria luteobubalina]|uniref:Fungal-type protein kinase domain-containing protein n=1 Tax=Armillaria luteobubalina TaxID=153913 RepID=A0AA39URJ7_9AGAR|nr:hypothetical protein EDD18DRAFT_1442434 [Armillaria luteobubalina]
MDSHASEPPRTPSPSGRPTDPTREISVKATPRNHRRTENMSHATGNMEAHRADVVEDLVQIPEISLEDYKKSILPPCDYLDYVDKIIEALQREGTLIPFDGTSNLRWSAFLNDPKDSGRLEDDTFKHMATIAADIVKAAREVYKDGPEPTTVMECKPNETILSEGRNGGFRSDGHYRILQSRRPRCFKGATSEEVVDVPPQFVSDRLACDRLALEEYKKKDRPEDRSDDFAKLVGNASQHMYADPTRRFMFGTTIEDTNTRFWFFSRAIVLTSEPFNFIEQYTHLIEYVLSLSFGTAEELGYDMSIDRVAYPLAKDSSEYTIQYQYRVGEKTYRTIECLSSFRASGLLSRATRVWRVFQLDDPDHQERALKDVWIPSDAKTEFDIQQEIFHSIEGNRPGIDLKYREHFVEILQCEVVRTSVAQDDMPVFVRQRLVIKEHVPLRQSATAKRSRIMSGSNVAVPAGGSYANTNVISGLQRLYKGRKHVRVVFADVGTPLSEVRNHSILFRALVSALKGLEYMFIGHYVHRDISAGNVLLCGEMAKISDLEYAKRFLSEGPKNDPKTGTPVYMAVEVQESRYEFYVPPKDNPKPVRGKPPPSRVEPIFLHNYLHDVESLFWVGLHTLFSTVPATPAGASPTLRKLQSKLFNRIFRHCLDGGPDRRDLLVTGNFLDAAVVLPLDYQKALEQTHFLQSVLVFKYKQAYDEPGFPQHENFNSVYSTEDSDVNLFSAFETVAEGAYNGDTQLLSDKVIDTPAPSRAMSLREDNDDDDDRAHDQSYVSIGSESESSESSGSEEDEEDEEPPNKIRRKVGNATQKKASGRGRVEESLDSNRSAGKRKSTHTHRESVAGTRSTGSGKRKRQL